MSQEPNLFSDGPDQQSSGPGFTGSSGGSAGRALDPLAVRMRPRTLAEFGLPAGDGIAKQTKSSKSFFVDLSAEKAAQIDSDIVVFDELQGAEPSKIKSNALLGKIPAIKNDTFVSIKEQKPSAAMSGPTVLSIPVALETFLPQLAAAAKKVK